MEPQSRQKFCLASNKVGYEQMEDQIEKFADYLSFLQYHFNNLNAKAKFKFIFNL